MTGDAALRSSISRRHRKLACIGLAIGSLDYRGLGLRNLWPIDLRGAA